MTYDLSRLGERRFEDLCRAIAVHVLGLGLQAFGDGPDGGREASFEGSISYPGSAGGPHWDGYVVLQAKYRRQRGAASDSEWLCREVTKELAAWCDPTKARVHAGRTPEYLIVATNAGLSSTAGTGGKDRVNELLRAHYEGLGLKGHAVWDANQISTYLDAYPGIRDRFAEFVTPGQVLAQAIVTMDSIDSRLADLASRDIVDGPSRDRAEQPDTRLQHAAYLQRLAQFAARCPDLTDRVDELAGLASFAGGSETYLHLQGKAWSGKTALVTTFGMRPPPQVDVVAFVVSRRDSETRLSQFLRAVCDQLADLLSEIAPSEPTVTDLLDLFNRAATRGQSQQRSLLLIVDGLDENDALTWDEPSIASQLPHLVPAGAHVLVTSRTSTVLPSDLDASHPLRRCRIELLPPSPVGASVFQTATHELDRVLRDEHQHRVVATIAVARGALSARDLHDLLSLDTRPLRRLLEGPLASIVEARPPGQGNSLPYTLAHDVLTTLIERDLDAEERAALRSDLDRWAHIWSVAGWPDETPDYLLMAYPISLAALRQAEQLARLASPARHSLLERRTRGDTAALTELADAGRLLAQADFPDLRLLARVAVLTHQIRDRAVAVPAGFPRALARGGRLDQGVQLARTIPYSHDRSRALLDIANWLRSHQPERAATIAAEAEHISGRLSFEDMTDRVQAGVLQALCGDSAAGQRVRATVEDLLADTDTDATEWRYAAVGAAVARLDTSLATRLLEEGVRRAEDPLELLAGSTDALVLTDRLPWLLEPVAAELPERQLAYLVRACITLEENGLAVADTLSSALEALCSETVELVTSYEADGSFPDKFAQLAQGTRFISTGLAQTIIRALLNHPDLPSDLQDELVVAIAAQGEDPRQVPSLRPSEFDLESAAVIASSRHHTELAMELAAAITDVDLRSTALSAIAGAVPADNTSAINDLLEAVVAAIRDVPSRAAPVLLAALTSAAARQGMAGLAECSLQRALDLLIPERSTVGDWGFVTKAALGQGRPVSLAVELSWRLTLAVDQADLLLHASKAVQGDPNKQRALLAELKTALPKIEEEIPGQLARVVVEVAKLAIDAGDPAEALELLQQLRETSTSLRVDVVGTEIRALLAAGHIEQALSAVRRHATSAPELSARFAVCLADGGRVNEARQCTTEILQHTDPAAVHADGRWPHAWLTLACTLSGMTTSAQTLLRGADQHRLVIPTESSWISEDLEVIVRLELWEKFAQDADGAHPTIHAIMMTEVVDEMLRAARTSDALPLIEELPDDGDKARLLAIVAERLCETDPTTARRILGRSLAIEMTPEAICSVGTLHGPALDEMGRLFLAGQAADGRPVHTY